MGSNQEKVTEVCFGVGPCKGCERYSLFYRDFSGFVVCSAGFKAILLHALHLIQMRKFKTCLYKRCYKQQAEEVVW